MAWRSLKIPVPGLPDNGVVLKTIVTSVIGRAIASYYGLEGKEGSEKIVAMINDFREKPPIEVIGTKVITIEDYQTSERLNLNQDKQSLIDLPEI